MKHQKLVGVTNADIHIRANEDGSESRIIEGYAIVFGQESVPMWEERGKPVVETIDAGAVTRELLDQSDIKMTMYHDMSRLLARSKNGRGSLAYQVDDRGVKFAFEAPRTAYGDEALELVRRGDIDGCSFMFATRYNDPECVERTSGDDKVTNNVKQILGMYDFTLTPDPAYPQTACEARQAGDAEQAKRREAEAEEASRREAEAEAERQKETDRKLAQMKKTLSELNY